VTCGAVLAGALAIAVTASAAHGAVHLATSDDNPELVKTIPITKHAGDRNRVVMSIAPQQLGDLQAGDRLEADAEVEVSVCLKKNPRHPGPGFPCHGKPYSYNPTVEAQIVLAPNAATATGVPVSPATRLSCSQRQPNRNHHCVLTVQGGGLDIPDPNALPCAPDSCSLNLVLTAFKKKARKRQKVVIGSDSRDGSIVQNKGRLDAVRFRPGNDPRPAPLVTSKTINPAVPIVPHGKDINPVVSYSIPLPNLREGERLVVDATAVAALPRKYSAFTSTQVILATDPRSTDNGGLPNHVAGHGSEIGKQNGFNCTPGRSAFPSPCTARKVGVATITHDSPQTLYLNVTTGMATQFPAKRHHSGDAAPVLANQGRLRVFRYPPE
jgi:hypothetical protein